MYAEYLPSAQRFWAMSYLQLYWKTVFSNCLNVFQSLKLCHPFKKKMFKFRSFLRQQGRFWVFCCHRWVQHLKTLLMCKIFIMKVVQLHRYFSLELFPFEWLFSPHRWSTKPQHHHSELVKAGPSFLCLSVPHLPHFLLLSAHLSLYFHFATFYGGF